VKIDSPESDHVDRVREQWRRERPNLETSPVAVVARLGRAARCLDYGLDQTLCRFGLSRASWDVLASLRRAGAPYELSPTELYRSLMRSSGAMTNRLRRLEHAGLVRRAQDPADGRGLLVALTATGRALVDEVAEAHLEGARKLLGGLSAEEQATLAALLRKLLLSFEREQPVPPALTKRASCRSSTCPRGKQVSAEAQVRNFEPGARSPAPRREPEQRVSAARALLRPRVRLRDYPSHGAMGECRPDLSSLSGISPGRRQSPCWRWDPRVRDAIIGLCRSIMWRLPSAIGSGRLPSTPSTSA